jgi:hypothetical protein
MPGTPRLLIVIVNYKTAALTVDCLASLEPELACLPEARVVVVENASGDGAALRSAVNDRGWSAWASVDEADRNGGFAYGNNRAIAPALRDARPPDYVLLLNADTLVLRGAVRSLIDFMEDHPQAGLAGSSFLNADRSDWPIAFRFITAWSELEQGLCLGLASRMLRRHVVAREMPQDRPSPTDWVAGACLIIRRSVFESIGLMDESYFLYFEETDFCLRARRAGWSCWYVPSSRVVHIAGQSTGVTVRDRRPPRIPSYWFESRRHYFVKNHGLAHAMAADLAFILGRCTRKTMRLARRHPDLGPPHFLGDFWSHSVLHPRYWARERIDHLGRHPHQASSLAMPGGRQDGH